MNDWITNTGGGSYIEGGVNTGGGDFVGRDQYNQYISFVAKQAWPGEEELRNAQRRLNEMPLEKIPPVAEQLPLGSRVPFPRNPLWIDRQDELRRLAKTLKDSKIVAVTGFNGIGKTQLINEFVHRYGQFFSGVFWLSFADPASVPTEVAACGKLGYLSLASDFTTLPIEVQTDSVIATWQSPLPRLLVFDNCEDENLLTQWWPTSGGCRILVSSRKQVWSRVSGVEPLTLRELIREDSVNLLCKYRPDLLPDDPNLGMIAEELGDLPLALHLVGSYLEHYRRHPKFGSPAVVLNNLRSNSLLEHPSLHGIDVTRSPTNHDLHLGRTFALTYSHLQPENSVDSIALILLRRTTLFAPGEPILRELLLTTVREQDEQMIERGLKRLLNLGLIREDEDGVLTLHRLMANFVKRSAKFDAVDYTSVEEIFLNLANHLKSSAYSTLPPAWQAHLQTVTESAAERNDLRGADLCDALGDYLLATNKYDIARSYLERALAIRDKMLGPETPHSTSTLVTLISLCYAQNDFSAARFYFERMQIIIQKAWGLQHENTADTFSNLGNLLYEQGDEINSLILFEQALAIREKVLGPEHLDTAFSLKSLGDLFYQQEDYAKALPYLERALAIREKVLGPEHIDTAFCLKSLGDLFYQQEDYAKALPYLERALAIFKERLGPRHLQVAYELGILGTLFYDQGDYTLARSYLKQTLEILEEEYGPIHPTTQQFRNQIAPLNYDSKFILIIQLYRFLQRIADFGVSVWRSKSNRLSH